MNRIFIMATGESINDIKVTEWEKLKKEKTLGISWFLKKNFETSYYYSHEFDTQPKKVAEFIKNNNLSTHLFLGTTHFIGNKSGKIHSPHLVYNEFKNKIKTTECKFYDWLETWNGKIWNKNDDLPPCSYEEIWAKTLDQPLCGFRGTLFASLNLSTILGYDEIILCGVDLNNGKHFYEKELSPFEKNILKDYDLKKQNHSTQIEYQNSHGVLSGLKWLSKYLTLKTTSKKSLLYDEGFQYFDIESL